MEPDTAADQPLDPTARVKVPEHVVRQAFPEETVLLNLESGMYHGLNPTGGRMLDELDGGATIAAASARLGAEFEQPVDRVERDMLAFCGDLLERGLIERAAG